MGTPEIPGWEKEVKTFACGHQINVLKSVNADRPCTNCRTAAELAARPARPASRRTGWIPRISPAERNLPPYDPEEDCNLALYRDTLRYGGVSEVDSDSYYEGPDA